MEDGHMKTIYTDQARAALLYGEKVAKKSNQNYIGTEHILAGLLHEPVFLLLASRSLL